MVKHLRNFFLTLGLLSITHLAYARLYQSKPVYDTYSNLIIFGDSQSDIGNMPESSNAGIVLPFAWNNLPYNLYVPFSNPVDLTPNDTLPPQPPLNGQYIRQARSLNWVQYLVADLQQAGELQSSLLLPWASVDSQNTQADFLSVNYAFAGALSNGDCANEALTPMPDSSCNANAILNAAKLYRAHPNQYQLRHLIPIPGTGQQVDFFADDLKQGKVKVDDNTLYLVWTGANDLSGAFKNLIQTHDVAQFYNILSKAIPEEIASVNNSIVVQLINLGAKQIMVIGQLNLGLAPEASIITENQHSFIARYLNAYILNALVLRYNLALANQIVSLQQAYPQTHITFVNLQSLFNRLSMLPQGPFYPTLGRACQNKDAATYQAIVFGKAVNCNAYLYWNARHLSNVGNEIVALAVKYALERST